MPLPLPLLLQAVCLPPPQVLQPHAWCGCRLSQRKLQCACKLHSSL